VTRNKHADKPSVELTEAEWAIMRAIWQHQPCAAGTVQEALVASKGWAYSTVKTTMDRMVSKGLLQTHKIRNLQLFSTTIGEVEAKRGELYKMLQRAFDGALVPMMQFLVEHEGLSTEEARQLRQIARQTGGAEKSDRADDPHQKETRDGRAQ
jgi:BlaI family penicillinase repressor